MDSATLERFLPWVALGAWAVAGVLWIQRRRHAAAVVHAIVAMSVLLPFALMLRDLVRLAALPAAAGVVIPRAFFWMAAAPVAASAAALALAPFEWRGRRWAAVATALLTAGGIGLMLVPDYSAG